MRKKEGRVKENDEKQKNRNKKRRPTQWDYNELAELATSPRFIMPTSNSGPLGK